MMLKVCSASPFIRELEAVDCVPFSQLIVNFEARLENVLKKNSSLSDFS